MLLIFHRLPTIDVLVWTCTYLVDCVDAHSSSCRVTVMRSSALGSRKIISLLFLSSLTLQFFFPFFPFFLSFFLSLFLSSSFPFLLFSVVAVFEVFLCSFFFSFPSVAFVSLFSVRYCLPSHGCFLDL